jgi:hypothetical protein
MHTKYKEARHMEITDRHWRRIRRLFEDAFRTSFHYALATVGENGAPHGAPIGSLILGEKGKGFYFEEFLLITPGNLRRDNRVCVLAVRTSKWLLLKSLLFGTFSTPPSVRLYGTVGEKREATPAEVRLFRKRVRSFRAFKGHGLLWSRLKYVRDVTFDSFTPA